jgi:hypothetical protein
VWNPKGGPNGTGAWEAPPDNSTQNFTQQNNGPFVPSAPTGQGGYSDATGHSNGFADLNGNWQNSGASLGKVRPMGGNGAWGGYTGTMVDDGHGGARYDASLNGRQEAVDRARGLGAAAGNRAAYNIDYSQADRFAAAGQQDRGYQLDALGMARDTAQGRNLQSMKLGQQMLQQGVQAQQAGAASTRGGSLAQAAAMRQQAAGQGAFMQQGNTMLQAQRAAEMAQGRDAYMGQATGLRSSDAQAQQQNQNQGISQMQMEMNQRQLNQQGQMGYEAQGQAINKGASDAALGADELQHGIDSAASKRSQQQADRQLQTGAAIAGTVGSVGASAAGAIPPPSPSPAPAGGAPGGAPGEARPYDPYSQAVSTSDERAKTHTRSLATAALNRRWR